MKHQYHPSFEEFRRLFERGNVVPVYRQLMADTMTPVLAFQKIASGPYGFLLESAAGPEKIGRYCFLGSSPFALFRSTGHQVEIREDAQTRAWEAENPLDEFRAYLGKFSFAPLEGLPRFSCGAVGYMAYDVVRFIEHLPDCPPDDRGLPDVFYMFYDEILIFDHLNKTLRVVCSQRTDGMTPDAAYREATQRIDRVIDKLRRPLPTVTDDIEPAGEVTQQYESNFERADYLTAVEKAKEYIVAGDIFQVVPSQRLMTATSAPSFDIYRALRVINPSPYMFYLRFDDLALIGSSPEVMVRVENR